MGKYKKGKVLDALAVACSIIEDWKSGISSIRGFYSVS